MKKHLNWHSLPSVENWTISKKDKPSTTGGFFVIIIYKSKEGGVKMNRPSLGELVVANVPMLEGMFNCSSGIFVPNDKIPEFTNNLRVFVNHLVASSNEFAEIMVGYLAKFQDGIEYYYQTAHTCYVGKLVKGVCCEKRPDLPWETGDLYSTANFILSSDPYVVPYRHLINLYPESFPTGLALFLIHGYEIAITYHSFDRYYEELDLGGRRNRMGKRMIKREYLGHLYAMLKSSIRVKRSSDVRPSQRYEEEAMFRAFDTWVFVIIQDEDNGRLVLKTSIKKKHNIYPEFVPINNYSEEVLDSWKFYDSETGVG